MCTEALRNGSGNRSDVVLRLRDANGVVLQWKQGSDATVEERIQRILALPNRLQ